MRGDFWSVLSEILIDKSAGSMQWIVVTHLRVISSVIRVIVRLRK